MCCGGNKELQEGDIYVPSGHFMHFFNQESELLGEIEESGFGVVENHFENGYVILTPVMKGEINAFSRR